jgi:valyl-tRNA synthetase
MSTELPKAYDPALIEEKWANYWVSEHLFDVPTPASPADVKNPFVQLLPPPNVTGRLHMGHMLNQTEMDILTRWHRMLGDTAVWIPGTDHAGIATQMMVERQLAAEGTDREALGRDAFIDRVWEWKHQYGNAITDQMRRLGASVDWSREYFTMDDRLSRAVKEAFVRLYEQGLIYRGAYIVNWDPILKTAVSDLEVTHEERAGKLYHVRYPLADGTGSIVIATTRPETMLGDVAVAVNPSDERYTAFIGKMLKLPLTDREIPVLADDWANPEFGTGAVKVTPAHDPNDFAIGQRHNLPQLNILDESAHIRLAGSPYDGMDRYAARERIVEDLRSDGALIDVKDHAHAIALSQRTGVVIEPRLSMQWFLAVNKAPNTPTTNLSSRPESAPTGAPIGRSLPEWGGLADAAERPAGEPARSSIAANAIAAVRDGHIKFTPEMYSKTYFEWMNNIHDWCISRQLWWGHRIPAWHCGACNKITVSLDTPGACSGCGITDIKQETDVLDTWFSSGLLPFTSLGWPGEEGPGLRAQGSESNGNGNGSSDIGTLDPKPWALTPDLASFYPTQLLVTGFDILFFWVARMIMLGTHFMLDVPMPDGSPRTIADAVPFRNVYIHALVRDADRQKMSKTKGNVVDPIEVVQKYGTDAVRFTLASQASPGTDIAFSEARTEGNRAFANKIWNAARFLQMQIERGREAGYKVSLNAHDSFALELPETTPLETRWIFARLSAVSAEVARALADYRFDEAANAVYQFFWGEFCDWYLELVKLRLNFVAGEGPGSRAQGSESSGTPTNLLSRPKRSAVEIPAVEAAADLGTLDPGPSTLDPVTALTLGALVSVFEAALRLLSPFMPFLTEELWHALYASVGTEIPAKSIALTRFPQAGDFPADATSVDAINILQELIVTVRGLRKDLTVPEKEAAPIQLFASNRISALADANSDMLAKMARVSAVELVSEAPAGNNSRATANFDVAVVYERQIDVPAERERLLKDLAKFDKGILAAEKQLGNEGFVSRAPAHIIEGLKKQYAETTALKEKAEAALAALPSD